MGSSRNGIVRQVEVLIIGVGNELSGEDAVGILAARRLRAKLQQKIRIVELSGEMGMLMESWKEAETVILIDAIHSDSESGTIYRFEANTVSLPTNLFGYSTHSFGVGEAIELGRILKTLPRHLIVYGIEGRAFESGDDVSLEVERALEKVEEAVLRDITQVNSEQSQETIVPNSMTSCMGYIHGVVRRNPIIPGGSELKMSLAKEDGR